MVTDNPFEKVLDWLREKGWQKDDWGNSDGPNCILGGLEYAVGLATWNTTTPILNTIAAEHYPDRLSNPDFPAISVNNHPDTTFTDVERVLEKAAVKWEEERVMRDD